MHRTLGSKTWWKFDDAFKLNAFENTENHAAYKNETFYVLGQG